MQRSVSGAPIFWGAITSPPLRHGQQRLAVLVLANEVVIFADEAVTGVGTDQVRLAFVPHHQMAYLFTSPQREATGERLALTAGGGQGVGLQRVGSPQGGEEHRLLVAAAMSVGEVVVPRLVGGEVDVGRYENYCRKHEMKAICSFVQIAKGKTLEK